MRHDLPLTVALLSRTPAALNALLSDLDPAWTRKNEGEETWTVFDVLGHLVLCEHVNWIPRARMVLEAGEMQTFAAVDRKGHLELERDKTVADLLEDFARLRSQNLATLQTLQLRPEDFERCGRHPALGVVTLSQLLAAWAAHDMTHLHQISRIMAHQYREAVGPWNRYLGVLRCAGHGLP